MGELPHHHPPAASTRSAHHPSPTLNLSSRRPHLTTRSPAMSAPDHPDNPTLPKTSDDVLRLVSLASSLELIGSTLIPTLHALCAPSSSAGGKSRQRSGGEEHKGEELLSSVLDDLVGDDVKLQRYTAAIVYALSAHLPLLYVS